MTPDNFCYWLKGFFELSECSDNEGKGCPMDKLSQDQVRTIKQHLDYVFKPQVIKAKDKDLIGASLDDLLKDGATRIC